MRDQTKICTHCGVNKPLAAYYTHPKTKDGLLGKCKECAKSASKAARRARIDYYRAYDRARSALPHRLEKNREVVSDYRKAHPDRYRAHMAVNNAIRDGRLKKLPCAVCGSERSVGHHADYSRPLDVVWLCQAHHKQLHAGALEIAA